ncbi:MAG: nucleoside triphosphate pyrophosphohydrolase [Deltaproteobacteria bacterium CG_4_10_14_0_2_um_filter_43_8]|nr:MAG: nucleoside triphosphate pyrophosphohydrolase [Deltaproteobacteria bacterium CG11_big_fil_rev_8_21_14_0_20_42_23]PJA21458.1 MAG: nucleoside triphosphate pyrophosphohydrolase [Deltaproteobacteria bacterium CG_4_10_14_0_2_um_filter_43_8]PJC63841.1 MAG: nucleoside triphosphate pyrophosphohydrolase [Deltaproteobacteria bacterium CG_4_9_14_0_2_um_filter_42_21]
MQLKQRGFAQLTEIMALLRHPEKGCPWDLKQSYQSITAHTIEEAYEVVDAIEAADFAELKEELGDLLLQVVFYAQMAREENRFTIDDVINGICEKLIRRHPHIFADVEAKDSETVLKNWEAIKQAEKKEKAKDETLLSGIPKHLPSLLAAHRIGEKTSRVGFDWKNTEGVFAKLEEEVLELEEAQAEKNAEAIEHEFGDVLFTLAQAGRHLGLNAETALRKANVRCMQGFAWMEKNADAELSTLSERELEDLWQQAKLHSGK